MNEADSKNRGLWRVISVIVVIVLIGLAGYTALTVPNLENQNRSFVAQNQALQTAQQEANSRLNTLSSELAVLNSTAIKSNGALSALLATESNLVTRLQSQLQTADSNVSSLNGVVARLQSQLQTADSNVSSLSSLMNQLRVAENASITNLKMELASADENYTIVSSEVAQLNGQIILLRSEIGQLESEIADLQSRLTQISSGGPALIQESGSTCSLPCGGSTTTTFSEPVTSGHMLVITVVVDNLTALQISDSFGTTMSQAVSTTNLPPSCGGLPPYCRAIIYWGILNSSGPEAITVSDSPSTYALRVQIWEFSGVNRVASTVSCTPICTALSYPAGSILIATARGNVSGGGAGFEFYQSIASYLAGSEYQIATSAGSTTFPFSTNVSEVESGAVLIEAPLST